jgi:hypothetical protein
LVEQKHWPVPVVVSQLTAYVFPSLQLPKLVEQKPLTLDVEVLEQPLVVVPWTHESHESPWELHASVVALSLPLSLQPSPAAGMQAMSAEVSALQGPSREATIASQNVRQDERQVVNAEQNVSHERVGTVDPGGAFGLSGGALVFDGGALVFDGGAFGLSGAGW